MTARHSFTYKLTTSQQERLTAILLHGNYRPAQVPYTTVAVKAEDCSVSLYTSGKCLVQGKGAQDFVTFMLEPQVLLAAGVGYEDVLQPQQSEAHMGIDESGKGDFFGPLVVAAVYVDESIVKRLRELEVRDSKLITSDRKAMLLGSELRRMLGNRFSLVKIGPESYNRLYSRMRNVNTMLGWAHARAIENLLEAVPGCGRAISDQFGSKQQVTRALMKKGKRIELEQRPRAESDPAVAAASVIAREMFLRALGDLEKKHEGKFPKGASQAVRTAAVELVRKQGPQVLLQTAKCHFKTADAVLKEAGSSREALGPEGQAVSRTVTRRKKS